MSEISETTIQGGRHSENQANHPTAEALRVDLPVDEVILLEDRAHVIRRGTITVAAGSTRLVVAGVAPVLSDRTLCASLRRPAGDASGDASRDDGEARVQELQIRRRTLVRVADRGPAAVALIREQRALVDRIRGLDGERARVQSELEEVESLAAATLAEIGVDASWGALDRERWRRELAELTGAEAELRRRLLALRETRGDLEAELRRLDRRRAAAADPRDTIVADLHLEVIAEAPGTLALQIDYIVPGACWRPYHRAELIEEELLNRSKKGQKADEKEARVAFTCEGCVWQRTGEDWRAVRLTFSTERRALGSEPPPLTSDLLTVARRREGVEVELRDQTIETTGLGQETSPARELPGIDDGGEVVALRTPGRVDIASDGRPHRFALFTMESKATLGRVLLGERAPAVIIKTSQQNHATQPLLAGPVDLIRGGGHVGRTSVLFIAPGERFALGWGPDPALRVTREVEVARGERGLLSSWTATAHQVTLRLSNLGDQRRHLEVAERVPISEVEKVRIEVDRRQTTAGVTADPQGIVTWNVDLAPRGHHRIELHYTVHAHSDVSGLPGR